MLTWLKIALYNYLILLLISPSNDKVILRADEPQELLKPAKLHQSMGGKPHWASRMLQRYFLCQSLRIHNLVSVAYKKTLQIVSYPLACLRHGNKTRYKYNITANSILR